MDRDLYGKILGKLQNAESVIGGMQTTIENVNGKLVFQNAYHLQITSDAPNERLVISFLPDGESTVGGFRLDFAGTTASFEYRDESGWTPIKTW